MPGVVDRAQRGAHRVIAHIVAKALRTGAVYDAENFQLWEQHGYHVTPVHFYYPIPDTRELRTRYPVQAPTAGIDLRVEGQRALLRDALAPYQPELAEIATRKHPLPRFSMSNDAFSGIDPYVYYALIRHFRPSTVLEIGSGFSTLLADEAVARTGSGRVVCVDPWPRDFIAHHTGGISRIAARVEDTEMSMFTDLQENDILFVDSSHVLRTGGDVTHIVLNVLPRLRPGVLVHFHDIYLPDEYPFDLIVNRLQFWTEQYLLHAYICENDHIEVIFGSNFMVRQYPEDVQNCFPSAQLFGVSFWFRKR
jgi:hypothetical protein